MKKILFFVISIFSITAQSQNTTNPDYVDRVEYTGKFYEVEKFSIHGVRLGMSVKNAVDAIKSSLELTEEDICYVYELEANNITKKKEIYGIRVSKEDYLLVVFFKVVIPYNRLTPQRVEKIAFQQFGANMKSSVFTKYGISSIIYRNLEGSDTIYNWCHQEIIQPENNNILRCSRTKRAELTYDIDSNILFLKDNKYQKAIDQYEKRYSSN